LNKGWGFAWFVLASMSLACALGVALYVDVCDSTRVCRPIRVTDLEMPGSVVRCVVSALTDGIPRY